MSARTSRVMLVLMWNCFVLSFVTSAAANSTIATSYTTVIQRSYYLSKDTPSSIAAAVLAGVGVVLLALLIYQSRQTSRQLQFLTSLQQQQQQQQPILRPLQRRHDEEEEQHFVLSTNPLVLSTDDKDSNVEFTSTTGTGMG